MPLRRSVLLLLFLLSSYSIHATAAALDTRSMFQRVSKAIVQVKISNIQSGEKSSIGSGFFVSNDGFLITNYHVISSVVREPGEYQIQLILSEGEIEKAELVDIDLIHDLALLKSSVTPPVALRFHQGAVEKGSELASIGNPHDLGMTVVKGSYSGTLSDSLYERIHFTGAINPGMSGGPALNVANEVVGINVATAGNEVGFLVPASYGDRLLQRARIEQSRDIDAIMNEQLLENQQRFSQAIFDSGFPLTEMGEFMVPDRWGEFIRCWGDSDNDEKMPYQIVTKQCSTEDDIYIDQDYSTGEIAIEHRLISSDELSAYRFSSLYGSYYADLPSTYADEEDVTSFACQSNFVHNGKLKMKIALCLRRHIKFEGLYDLVLKGATMERDSYGVQTSLLVTGIARDNALKLARKYINSFGWKE
ncbi:MAG: serine protease [Chromatiales bacterium]|nr:serine protease [Chromatiales bacterium]